MAEPDERLLMLIDDEPAQSRLISALAGRAGWRTHVVHDGETAIATLGTRQGMQLSAIILDQWVPGDDACDLIAELKSRRPGLPILMLTTSTSPQLAVDAMRAGASDYLVKPVAPDRLMQALRCATTNDVPSSELQTLSEKFDTTLDFDSMIGANQQFRTSLARAAKAARGHGHIMIEGETGTGKDMLVRAIQAASPRAKLPFRIINVRGVAPNAIESVLFGHEQGAFPGAFDRQIGVLQQCDTGTVVLDEINRMPMDVQSRLAEAVTSGRVRPVGARHSFRIDVRIIAATNQPLADMVEAGTFREDLYQPFAATRISLPPLRERGGDIRPLARYFLQRIGDQPGLRELGITDGALSLLGGFDWPGNIRQLQAVLFRAAVHCDGDALTAEDFPHLADIVGTDGNSEDHFGREPQGAGVMLYSEDGNLRPLEEIEADVIRLAIGHYRGRMTEVARRLGIGRSTLYRKLSNLGIDNVA